MSRTRNSTIATLAAALVATALAPGADAAYQDLRSPDAQDAARTSPARAYQDLRSPDAQDAARTSPARAYQDLRSADAQDAARTSPARAYQDLRSPDARDAGQPHPSPPPTPTSDSTGTDWGDVGIVAGGVLMPIGLAGLILFGRRRSSTRKSRAPAVSS